MNDDDGNPVAVHY